MIYSLLSTKSFYHAGFCFKSVSSMGGAKKKSMSKMETNEGTGEDQKPQKKAKGKGKMDFEKKEKSMRMPDINNKKLISDLSKMGAITPYAVASQLNLRISLAKDLLVELEKKQLIKSVGGNSRVKIYEAPAAA
jgi:small subunit ribosomal protein S25e